MGHAGQAHHASCVLTGAPDALVKVNVVVLDLAGDAGKESTVAKGTIEASPPDWPGLAPLTVKLQGVAHLVSPAAKALHAAFMAACLGMWQLLNA